jgi:membrane protease subunit (stomatin/prohibitin family)
MAKKNSMIKIGDLKGVVGGMRKAMTEREDERTMLQKNRNLGLAPDQDKAAASRIAQLRKENAYYAPIAERYQGLIDSKTKGRDIPLPSSSQLFNKK